MSASSEKKRRQAEREQGIDKLERRLRRRGTDDRDWMRE